MKKNLKKVISAVIALAISASAFATVSFAKSFTDVASTASYAEAVDVLSALGIINGYEDGSFQPEKTIKRSEAAKIIVAMNNKLATAESRKGATKFNDVAANHWASGFVNVGVADGFINGKGEGRFDPDGEVKYAEVVKMIVSCMNYNEYANFYGGYPDGFINIADELEITDGCSMEDEAAATRGVVAQLVYNALKTPIVKSKGMQYSAVEGGFVPGIEKQDGIESKYVKTLLTEKFDAYLVEGRVTGTYKSGASVEMDEIKFTVDDMEKYDLNDAIKKGTEFTAKVGDTLAADYVQTFAEAIVQIDDANRKTLISFIPSGKNISVVLDLALLDDEEANIKKNLVSDSNPFVYFYATDAAAKSTKYKLEEGYKLFVNGIEIKLTKKVDGKEEWDEAAAGAAADKYILPETAVGTIEFIDTFKSNDGYDIINVEYFNTTKVTSVTAKKVFFNSVDGISNIDIDEKVLEEKEIEVNAYLNGEAIDPSEIKKDDIISIKKNPIGTSNFYDIYVSRDVQEGTFKALDADEKVVTIGSEDYIFVNWDTNKEEFKKENLSNEYKVYLDAFGRIYTWERSETSARYAIVDKYQVADSGTTFDSDRVRLWFTDGTYKYVEFGSAVTSTAKDAIAAQVAKLSKDENGDKLAATDTEGFKAARAREIGNLVVSYKISTSTGKLTSIELVTGKGDTRDYDARNNKIGSTIVNSATTFINVEEYLKSGKIDDIETSSIDALVNDASYTFYRYGSQSLSDNSFPLVLITRGEASYTEETTFAVVTKTPGSGTAEDGTVLDTLTVLYEGEEQELYFDEDYSGSKAFVAGDVIVLKKTATGKIKETVKIFDAEKADFGTYSEQKAFALNSAKLGTSTELPVDGKPFTKLWNPSDSDLTTKLIYAPIVSRNGRNYFAQVDSSNKTYLDKDATDNVATAEGATLDILATDATNVYVYDYNAAKNEKFYVGSTGDIVGTPVDFAKSEGEDGYYTVTWNDGDPAVESEAESVTVNFAFAKIVDDIVTDIFVIIGDDE